jgi:hypothetical protein
MMKQLSRYREDSGGLINLSRYFYKRDSSSI